MRHLGYGLALVLLAGTLAAAQGTYYRGADGKWQALKTTVVKGATRFTLSPALVGGGSTVVVLHKPAGMVLGDEIAPVVGKVRLDGVERPVDQLDLGWLTQAPGEVVLAVADEKNPLDLAGLRVTLNQRPLPAAQVAVQKLTPEGKQARVAVTLGDLPPDRYQFELRLADQSPAANMLRLRVEFTTAPLLANGGFEEADKNGDPARWSVGPWSSNAETKYEAGVRPGGVEGKLAYRCNGLAGSLNVVCSQRVDGLRGGVTYVYTGQYRSSGGAGLSALSNLAGKELDYLSQSLPPATEWTPFAWEFKLQDHEFALIVVRCGSKGETWFDDLKLVPK